MGSLILKDKKLQFVYDEPEVIGLKQTLEILAVLQATVSNIRNDLNHDNFKIIHELLVKEWQDLTKKLEELTNERTKKD